MPAGHHTPAGAVAKDRGMTIHWVRRLHRAGFLDVPGATVRSAPVRGFTMTPGEDAEGFLGRLLTDFPPLEEGNVAEFREALHALKRVRDIRLPEERLDQGAAILGARHDDPTAFPVTITGLHALTGGDRAHLSTYVARHRAREVEGIVSQEAIRRELQINPPQIEAFLAFGILEQTAGPGCRKVFGVPGGGEAAAGGGDAAPLAMADVQTTVLDRFWNMPPRGRPLTIDDINLFCRLREAMQVDAFDRLPPNMLADIIQFIIGHGQPPTVQLIQDLVHGDETQLRDALIHRHRTVGDIPFPRRTVTRTTHTLADLDAMLAPELRGAHGTFLDPVRRKAGRAPTGVDIASIAGIANPTLRAVAQVVALHGRTRPKWKMRVSESIRMLRGHADAFDALPPTDAAAVASCLTALRLVANGTGPEERAIILSDILAWRTMAGIFDDYRANPELPPALSAYLDTIAPALPADDTLFEGVSASLETIRQKRYEDRVGDMEAILADVRGFGPRLFARRDRTRALRAKVREVVEEHEAGGADHASFLVRDAHVEEIARAAGEAGPRRRITTFEVISWDRIAAELRPLVPLWQKLDPHAGDKDARKRALFECRYAVRYVSCVHEDSTPAEPPHWFELHERKLLWPVKQLTTEEFAERGPTLERLGLGHSQTRAHGTGLGNFERHRARIARLARTHLGMTLLPLDEHNHQEALSILQVAMRLEEPLRTGEFAQLNVGEGAESEDDEDGEAFTVFKFYRKKKRKRSEAVFSPEVERLAEEVLTITSERMYGGGEIPPVPAPKPEHPKSPATERFLAAYGERSASIKNLGTGIAFLCAGIGLKRPHDLKYLWNRLERLKGRSLEERRKRQEHVATKTTEDYNPPIAADRTESRRKRRAGVREDRERREQRNEVFDGLTDEELLRLNADRERLRQTIPWLEVRKLAGPVAKARRELAKVEVALARNDASRAGEAA